MPSAPTGRGGASGGSLRQPDLASGQASVTVRHDPSPGAWARPIDVYHLRSLPFSRKYITRWAHWAHLNTCTLGRSPAPSMAAASDKAPLHSWHGGGVGSCIGLSVTDIRDVGQPVLVSRARLCRRFPGARQRGRRARRARKPHGPRRRASGNRRPVADIPSAYSSRPCRPKMHRPGKATGLAPRAMSIVCLRRTFLGVRAYKPNSRAAVGFRAKCTISYKSTDVHGNWALRGVH